MNSEFTQDQSSADRERSQALSLEKTRPPTEVPGYTAERFIGSGAYGEVWAGLDKNTGRRVAIKFYAHRQGVDWSLLAREVEKLVFLSTDRYVVQLLVVGWDADPPYYVMEYIENGSLEDHLRRDGTFDVHAAVEMFREIAVGLSHSHGRGVLHCDLKPANILLDGDGRPRLADFGQSRLTSEQKPALGTLFYMAPEQADLAALPDVRWDVYALGAILYCLLVGSPPHRNDGTISQIETAANLNDRLARYRQAIASSPTPTEHRQIPGVDKPLADLIERCLAAKPAQRFANVQEVLDALDVRQKARARLPLLVAGILLPLLVLLVTALFSWRGYESASQDTQAGYRTLAMQSNSFAARWAAERVTSEISQYFQIIEDESSKEKLHDRLHGLLADPTLAAVTRANLSEAEASAARQAFVKSAAQQELAQYLQSRLSHFVAASKANSQAPKFASIFVTDARGTQLAAAFNEDVGPQRLGNNLAHRVYFHGKDADLPEFASPPQNPPHVERVHFSTVFKSSSTQKWKVAVSIPLYHEAEDKAPQFEGLLVLTINLGDFEFFRPGGQVNSEASTSSQKQLVVLVDGRPGANTGTILQHPLFTQVLEKQGKLPAEFRDLRVDPAWLADTGKALYQDPLASHPLGQDYAGEWIASTVPVRAPVAEGSDTQSGLIVLVQSDYQAVVAPVQRLSVRFVQNLVWMLVVVIVVSGSVWYIVWKMSKSAAASQARSLGSGGTSPAPSPHELTTQIPDRATRNS